MELSAADRFRRQQVGGLKVSGLNKHLDELQYE